MVNKAFPEDTRSKQKIAARGDSLGVGSALSTLMLKAGLEDKNRAKVCSSL